MPECDLDPEITGFEAAEIDNLMVDLRDAESEPADVIPPVTDNSCVIPGDLWLLGPHLIDTRYASAGPCHMHGVTFSRTSPSAMASALRIVRMFDG